LPNIQVPTLIIQGADDEYGTLAQVEAAQAAIPHRSPRWSCPGAATRPIATSPTPRWRPSPPSSPACDPAARESERRIDGRFTGLLTSC
jgi:pimeloyl-ACP methyl ester carboxylesterase